LPAYFVDPGLERTVENSVEHGEFASHLNLSPQGIRDLLDRVQKVVGAPESPVVAVVSSGARCFLRQLVEPTVGNLFFLSHNEIPAGVKVVSLGVIA
jgi:type III secretory pathway component EscV